MDSVSVGKGNPSGLPEVWFGFWLFIYVIRACNSTTRQREIKTSNKGEKKKKITEKHSQISWLSRTRVRVWWTFKAASFGSAADGHHLVSVMDGTCHLLPRYPNPVRRFLPPASLHAAEREAPDQSERPSRTRL